MSVKAAVIILCVSVWEKKKNDPKVLILIEKMARVGFESNTQLTVYNRLFLASKVTLPSSLPAFIFVSLACLHQAQA